MRPANPVRRRSSTTRSHVRRSCDQPWTSTSVGPPVPSPAPESATRSCVPSGVVKRSTCSRTTALSSPPRPILACRSSASDQPSERRNDRRHQVMPGRPTSPASVEERHDLLAGPADHLAVVRVGQRGAAAFLRVDADGRVDLRVDQAAHHEHRDERDDEALVGLLAGRELRHAAGDLVAGEGDVARLLHDVDAVDLAHQRLDALVVRLLALQAVEHLLGDEDRAVGGRAPADDGEELAELADRLPRPVGLDAGRVDHAREHLGVAALVGHLGERVLRAGRRRVLGVEVLEQALHEQDLEPQADRGDAAGLVLAELDALLGGEALPELGAVEGDAVLGHPDTVRHERGVPVDVDRGVVGLLRRRLQEPFRGLVPVRRGRTHGWVLLLAVDRTPGITHLVYVLPLVTVTGGSVRTRAGRCQAEPLGSHPSA